MEGLAIFKVMKNRASQRQGVPVGCTAMWAETSAATAVPGTRSACTAHGWAPKPPVPHFSSLRAVLYRQVRKASAARQRQEERDYAIAKAKVQDHQQHAERRSVSQQVG